MKNIIILLLLLISANGYSQKYKYSIFAMSTHNLSTGQTSMPEQKNLTAYKTEKEFSLNGINYRLISMNKTINGSETKIDYKATDSRGAKCTIHFIENINLEYDNIILHYEGDNEFVIYTSSKPYKTFE